MARRTRTRTRQRHDKLFRLVFSDRREAAAFLRARLPDSLGQRFRWSTLRRIPGSFVNQELRGLVTDLLFEVRAAAGGGNAARQRLCLLFEHQSRPDRWMALRVMRYCCGIWEAGRQSHPKERFLRPVLPVVFYQGRRPWRYAQELAESFPPEFRGEPWVPRLRYLVFDQTRVAPEQVVGALRGRLLQLAMMHAFKQAPAETRERCVELLAELKREPVRGGVDYVQAFLGYILKTGARGTMQALDDVVDRRAPELRGDLMTSGEELRREGLLRGRRQGRREGRQQGRQEGRQQGRQEGRQQGRLETIEGLLRAGVDWPVIESATGIDEQTFRGHKADLASGKNGSAL